MPLLNSLPHAMLEGSKAAFLGFRPFISSVNFSSNTVAENQSLTFNINTLSVTNYSTVSYSITGIDSSDITSGSLTGTLNILNNQSTSNVTLTFAQDYVLEGNETITVTFELNQRATYSAQVTLTDTSRPTFEITLEPPDTEIVYYANNSSLFTVGVAAINSGSNNYTYQWQRSINAGTSWSNLTSNSIFGGTTSNTLSVGTWAADGSSSFQGAFFRCRITDSENGYSLTSRSAQLTVTSPPYGAVVVAASSNTQTWTVPANVYAISAVMVGGGGGGGGSKVNQNYWEGAVGGGGGGGATLATGIIKVLPGEQLILKTGPGGSPGSAPTVYSITLAQNGSPTYVTFPNTAGTGFDGTISAGGGTGGGANSYTGARPSTGFVRYGARGNGGTVTLAGNITSNRIVGGTLIGSGGTGGLGGIYINAQRSAYYAPGDSRAGGGAGGYGGGGGDGATSSATATGSTSIYGGGGGGGGCGVANLSFDYSGSPNAGGGVGLFGKGNNGTGGNPNSPGGGGSSGANGSISGGGSYGGGGQADQGTGKSGAPGGLRIVFGRGNGSTSLRSFAANVDVANTSNTISL